MSVSSGLRFIAALLLAAPVLAAETPVQALREAALQRDTGAVAALLEQGDAFRSFPAWLGALTGGSDEVVRLFLKKGVDPNAPIGEHDTPPLLFAANRGYTDICQTLIEAGARVDGTNKWDGTALAAAAQTGRVETIKLLLARGADPHHIDSTGNTPLEHASEKLFLQAADILRQAMLGKPRSERMREFLDAIRKHDDQAVAKFLAEPAISYFETIQGLMLAAASGNTGALRQCLASGARANTHGPARFTPLLYAAIRGEAAMADALIEAEADVNYENASGLTPLMAAAKGNHASLVKKLIAAGAALDQTDREGRSALSFADARGCEEAARVLREAGAILSSAPVEPPAPRTASTVPDRVIAGTVALAPFTSADNSWPSIEAAEQFSALLQLRPEVAKVPWVERAEIGKAERELNLQPGFTDPSASVRLGKWLRADLLVSGQFGLDEGEGRTLEIEVIDLRRADVLARRSLPVPSRLGENLEIAPDTIAAAGRLVFSALAEAEERLAATAGSIVLAPFDFHNVTRQTDRLNFVGDKLRDALGEVKQKGLRVVRFPRADEASGEAELSVSGLVEDDADAWRKLADVYMWGTYEEISPEGKDFDAVEVRVDLEIWNGTDPAAPMTGTFRVAEMDTALPRLAARIAKSVAESKRQEPGESARLEAARRLFARATEMQAEERDLQESSRRTIAWLQNWRRRAGLLDIARFLAPADATIDREWMIERWNEEAFFSKPYRDNWYPHQFWGMWRQCEAWGRHVERFGFEAMGASGRDYLFRAKLPRFGSTRRTEEQPLQDTFIYMAFQAATYLSYVVGGYPDPVPASLQVEWQDRFTREFVRRLQIVADQCPDQYSIRFSSYSNELEKIQNPHLLAEAYAAIWKLSGSEKTFDTNFEKIREGIAWAFTSAGRRAELEDFQQKYAGPQIGNPGYTLGQSDREARMEKLAEYEEGLLRRSELLPGERRATFREIKFEDGKVSAVTHLCHRADRIWLAARRDSPKENRLWCYDPATESAKPSANAFISDNQEFTVLLADEAGLWIGTEGSGVWRYDPETKTVQKFTSKEGLATPNVTAAALGADTLFIGGGANTAAMGTMDLATGKWAVMETPDGSDGVEFAVPAALATSGGRLATVEGFQRFQKERLAIFDRATAKWHQPAGAHVGTVDSQSIIHFRKPVLVGDDMGFWVGLGRNLTHFDHSSDSSTLDLEEALGGGITAMADEGDFLWVAGSSDERVGRFDYHFHTRVVLIRKATKSVVAFVTVPYNAPVTSMIAHDGKLYLGLITQFGARASFLQMETASLRNAKRADE